MGYNFCFIGCPQILTGVQNSSLVLVARWGQWPNAGCPSGPHHNSFWAALLQLSSASQYDHLAVSLWSKGHSFYHCPTPTPSQSAPTCQSSAVQEVITLTSALVLYSLQCGELHSHNDSSGLCGGQHGQQVAACALALPRGTSQLKPWFYLNKQHVTP